MKTRVIQAMDVAGFRQELDSVLKGEFQPNLVFCFCSDSLLTAEFPKIFQNRSLTVFGTSSREEIAGDQLLTDSVTALLLELPDGAFAARRFQAPEKSDSTESSRSLGRELADWSRGCFSNPALLTIVGGAGFTVKPEKLLVGLFETAPEISLFGGVASMRHTFGTSWAFDARGRFDDGLLALVLDQDQVEVSGVAVSGWRAIGTAKQITRSSGNTVYEIDHLPATEFYHKYFKVSPDQDDELVAVMEYPLQLTLEDGRTVMRTPIQLDGDNQAVVYGGEIPRGSRVHFCSPNIVETIRLTIDELREFRRRNRDSSEGAILLFDCAIRSQSFGSYMQKEIRVIRDLWGLPLAGFSSWGEIGNPAGEKCGFHNTTISLVVLRPRLSGEEAEPGTGLNLPDLPDEDFLESDSESTPESLRRQIKELRKQKTMLSHFLHLTSEDLDRANRELDRERKKSDVLLLNILPEPVAARLKGGEKNIADEFAAVTVLFADLAGFTQMAAAAPAAEIVRIINKLFTQFDHLCQRFGVEKIKTIGDAYMAVAGLPQPVDDHAARAFRLARAMVRIIPRFNKKYGTELGIRIGLHSGPVVAGVIGKNKFIYDLWGDTVNTASRMESHGLAGAVQLSGKTREYLPRIEGLEPRGVVQVKGKGEMETWLWRPGDGDSRST